MVATQQLADALRSNTELRSQVCSVECLRCHVCLPSSSESAFVLSLFT